MHVVTFTRSTPDTAAKVWVDETGAVTWGEVATVVNPWDEYSLEETIVQAKKRRRPSNRHRHRLRATRRRSKAQHRYGDRECPAH